MPPLVSMAISKMRSRRLLRGLLLVLLVGGVLAWRDPITGVYSHRYAEDEYLVVLPKGQFMLIPSQGQLIKSKYRIVGHPTLNRFLQWVGLHFDEKYGLRLSLPNDPEGIIEMEGWGPETIHYRDGVVSLGSWRRLSEDGSVAQAWEARDARRR
jgi:hypothetical protein